MTLPVGLFKQCIAHFKENHFGINHAIRDESHFCRQIFLDSQSWEQAKKIQIEFLFFPFLKLAKIYNFCYLISFFKLQFFIKLYEIFTPYNFNPNKSGIGGKPPTFVQNDFTPWCLKLNIFYKSDMGHKLYDHSFWIL